MTRVWWLFVAGFALFLPCAAVVIKYGNQQHLWALLYFGPLALWVAGFVLTVIIRRRSL